jgi:hypothetical protein
VGTGYTLTISAYREDGVALYSGERIEIAVLPGVNDLGVLNTSSFESSLTTPASEATDVDFAGPVFGWEAATGAAGYQLFISTTPDLSNPFYSAIFDSNSVTLPDEVLAADSHYWWGVVPVDFDGRPGDLNADQMYAFSTSSTSSGTPVISDVYDELLDTYAECIDSGGNTFFGYNYMVYFDYQDADGNAGESDGAYINVNGYNWDWLTFDGDSANGTVSVNYCSSSAGDRLTLIMVDGAGSRSNTLTIDLTIP